MRHRIDTGHATGVVKQELQYFFNIKSLSLDCAIGVADRRQAAARAFAGAGVNDGLTA